MANERQLMTAEQVIETIDLDAGMDQKMIDTHIQDAQMLHIKSFFGTMWPNLLIDRELQADGWNTQKYDDLWEYMGLKRAYAFAVELQATGRSAIQFTPKGMVKVKDEYTEAASARDIGQHRSILQETMAGILDDLHKEITSDNWYNPRTGAFQDNTTIYTLYPANAGRAKEQKNNAGLYEKTGVLFPDDIMPGYMDEFLGDEC